MAKRLPLTHAMKRLNQRLEGQTGTTIRTARVTNRNPSGGNSATYTLDSRGSASQGWTTTGGDFEPGQTVMTVPRWAISQWVTVPRGPWYRSKVVVRFNRKSA